MADLRILMNNCKWDPDRDFCPKQPYYREETVSPLPVSPTAVLSGRPCWGLAFSVWWNSWDLCLLLLPLKAEGRWYAPSSFAPVLQLGVLIASLIVTLRILLCFFAACFKHLGSWKLLWSVSPQLNFSIHFNDGLDSSNYLVITLGDKILIWTNFICHSIQWHCGKG